MRNKEKVQVISKYRNRADLIKHIFLKKSETSHLG